MKHWLIGLFCALVAVPALAARPSEVLKRAEASMLVSGSIAITPDGHVSGYALDHPEKLPPGVVQVVKENLPSWTFQRNDKRSGPLKLAMTMRIVAKRLDPKHYSIRIAAAHFGQPDYIPGLTVSYRTHPAPRYPRLALDSRVAGTVYLLLRIGRDGRVLDSAAEQVNLTSYGSDREMTRFRGVLAEAALKAVRHWTFNTPTSGKHVADPYWTARVPIAFDLRPFGLPKPVEHYGQWQVYIPGPRQAVPWVHDPRLLAGAADALADGRIQQVGQGPQLTSALNASGG